MCDLFQQNDSVFAIMQNLNQNGQQPNHMTPQDFCTFVHEMSQTLTKFLLHIMHVPVVTLILITLFGKENEDAKWFVFHTAILNLILGITLEIIYFYPDSEKTMAIQIMLTWSLGLAVESIFPLAFTRFFYLYFSHIYEKIFTKKTILPWLLAYDVAMLVHLFSGAVIKNIYICLSISSILLIGTIFCSTLVFLKIRGMMKMVGDSKLSIHGDLRKAAFICLFQSCVNSVYMISSIYIHVYADFFMDTSMNSYGSVSLNGQNGAVTGNLNENLSSQDHRFEYPSQSPSMMNQTFSTTMPKFSYFLLFSYMLLDEWQYPLYQLYVILDTLMTLIVLRTYRNALKKVLAYVVKNSKNVVENFVWYRGEYNTHESSMYKKRPSVNQWTY